MNDSPILTAAEAADLLKVKLLWLQRSPCPRIRHGHIVRYHRDVVLAWFSGYEQAA